MKEKKILIMIGVIAAVILIIIATVVISLKKDEEEVNFENENTYEPVTTVQKVNNNNKYYAVENIIDSYFNTLLDEETKSAYNILDPEYIRDFNISENEVIQKMYALHELDGNPITMFIEDMYIVETSINTNVFFAYGYTRNNYNEKQTNFKIMVLLDTEKNAYSIIPTDGVDKLKYDNLEEGQNIDLNQFADLEVNEYNGFDGFVNISKDVIISDYLKRFKEYITYDKQKAYEILNKEYRDKKFASFEEFDNYIKENILDIYSASICKYGETEDGELIGVDEQDNYYVFKEKSTMEFEMMLDIYTLPLEENIETYNEANDQQKVAININKWIMALNNRDYKYMHSVLNKTFAQNHFPRVEDLANFMSQNFYENNQLSLTRYQVEGTTHIYSLSVINAEDETQTKEFNIMMRLNEDNTFEMSFGE